MNSAVITFSPRARTAGGGRGEEETREGRKPYLSRRRVSRDSPFSIAAAWPAASRGFPASRYTRVPGVQCAGAKEKLSRSRDRRVAAHVTVVVYRDTRYACARARVTRLARSRGNCVEIRGAETKRDDSALLPIASYARLAARGMRVSARAQRDASLHKTRDFTRRL